jgi:hypothetical protein
MALAMDSNVSMLEVSLTVLSFGQCVFSVAESVGMRGTMEVTWTTWSKVSIMGEDRIKFSVTF